METVFSNSWRSLLYLKGDYIMTLYEDLKWRGLIKDVSSPDLEDKLNQQREYRGFGKR